MNPAPRFGRNAQLERFLVRQRREIMLRIAAAETRRKSRWGAYALAAAVAACAFLLAGLPGRAPLIALPATPSSPAVARLGDSWLGDSWLGDWDLAGTSATQLDPLAAYGDWSDSVARADADGATSLLPPLDLDEDEDNAAPGFNDDLSWLRFPAAHPAALQKG